MLYKGSKSATTATKTGYVALAAFGYGSDRPHPPELLFFGPKLMRRQETANSQLWIPYCLTAGIDEAICAKNEEVRRIGFTILETRARKATTTFNHRRDMLKYPEEMRLKDAVQVFVWPVKPFRGPQEVNLGEEMGIVLVASVVENRRQVTLQGGPADPPFRLHESSKLRQIGNVLPIYVYP
jgi:hypothetical protein